MQERKIGIILNYLSLISNAIVGFLYVPILLHYIGTNEFGLYQLIGSLIAYFSVMDFGLSNAIVRFYTRAKTLQDRVTMENVLAIALRAYFIIAIIMGIVGTYVYYHIDWVFQRGLTQQELDVAKQLFSLLIINVTITIFTTPFRAIITAHQKFIFLKSLDLIQLIIQPLLVIFFLNGYPHAITVAIVQTGLNLIGIFCRAYYCFYRIRVTIHLHYWDHELIRGFKKLALSIFFVAIIDQIFFKTNQVILGAVSGAAAVAVYAIASTIYMNYMNFSTAVTNVYLPLVTELVTKENATEEISNLFIEVGRWQFFLLGFILSAFVLLGQFFITHWAGPSFYEAYYIAIIIMVPFTIDLIQNIGLTILQAYNKYGFRARVYWVVGIFNLVIAIPLAIYWGGIGCALGTGFSMLIGNGFIMNWYYAKKIQLDIMRFWSEIAKIVISIGVALVMGWEIQQYWGIRNFYDFIGFAILYSIIYLTTIWKMSMNSEEKLKIINFKNKVIR